MSTSIIIQNYAEKLYPQKRGTFWGKYPQKRGTFWGKIGYLLGQADFVTRWFIGICKDIYF